MKIAMTVSNDVIDDVRVIREAKTLSEAGYEVYIFGNSYNGGSTNIDNIKIINSKYPIIKKLVYKVKTRIDKNNMSNSTTSMASSSELSLKQMMREFIKGIMLISTIELTQLQIIKKIRETKIKFDYIHCHDLDTLKVGIMVKRLFGTKLIYDSHELWTEMSGINHYVKKRYSKIEEKLIINADHIITVSPSIAEELKNRYKSLVPSTLVRNIPSYQAIDEVKMPDDKEIKLIYIGYYIKGRGVEDILNAALSFPQNTKLYLRVQKDAAILNELNNRVCQLGLKNKVRIDGFVPQEQVISEISKHDIGILPYLPVSLNNLYCLPNKIFQYFSAGVCVVSNNLPDVKEIITKYECGLIYDESNSIIDIVSYLSKNPEILYTYKMNSLKAIQNDLNWNEERTKLIDLYRNLKL